MSNELTTINDYRLPRIKVFVFVFVFVKIGCKYTAKVS